MNLRFIYVVKSDRWQETLREEWLYIYKMAKFYQWWLRRNFHLHYKIGTDVLVIVQAPLMQIRFGMRDLVRHHREKGEDNYHVYLSYFKPRISDCSSGSFADNFGLTFWKNFAGEGNKTRFLALENCTRVSHMLLHEVGRRKNYGKKYKEAVHDQWEKHLYGAEDYELYDTSFRKVPSNEDYMFATMKIPEVQEQ